ERFLDDTDVALLLDSGHLAVAGGDPIAGLRDWAQRIEAVHLKDVRLGVLRDVKAERADTLTAWRRGLFCALGDGDVDLAGFCSALAASGYEGWVVIEQGTVLEDALGVLEPGAHRRAAPHPRVSARARRMVSAADRFDVITMGRIGVDVYPLQAGVSLRE